MAALFHDCGYPYQYHHEHHSKLRQVYHQPLGGPADVRWGPLERGLRSMAGPLGAQDLANRASARHQFVGAAELCALELAYERGAGSSERPMFRRRRRELYSLAIRAIKAHHVAKDPPGDPVAFSQNPLGFLLILSDELHELERPRGTPSTHSSTRLRTARTEICYEPGEVVRAWVRWPDRKGARLTLGYQSRRKANKIQ
ncbi:unnamed protein product, partial [marine sediment metagenome]